MISDHKTTIEWKIQLIMQINFISHSDSILVHILNLISISDSEETRTRYTKSRNIEIMEGNETDEIIKELFESLLQNYQKNLEEPMRGSKFVPDSNDL